MSKLVYCHCAYAKVVPEETKQEVLKELVACGEDFLSVPDLCEMAARKDPELKEIFSGEVRLAACYKRAVKWLCHSGGVEIPEDTVEFINMRTEPAEEVCRKLLRKEEVL